MRKSVSSRIKPHLPYLLFFLVFTPLFLSQFLDSTLPGRDMLTGYYPQIERLKISLTEYGDFWPLWDPYGFSGNPLLMKPSEGLDSFYFPLLLLVPSTVLALKLNYLVLFLIAGISMYFFAQYLGLERRYAFIAAFVYILNAHMLKLLSWGWSSTLSGYALMPLGFMLGMKAVMEKDWLKYSVLASIVFSLLFRMNADNKVTMWFGLYFGLFLVYHVLSKFSKARLVKTGFAAFFILVLFFGLSAQRIVPQGSFIGDTSRGNTVWEQSSGRQIQYSDIPRRLIEPLYEGFPDIQRKGISDHVGIIAFLLGAFAIWKRWRNKQVLFFTIASVFAVLVTTNTFGLYKLLWNIVPFFKSLRYIDRSIFMFAFCFSILAGFGAAEFSKRFAKKNVFFWSLLGLLFLNLVVFNVSPYSGVEKGEWYDVNDAIAGNDALQFISSQPGHFRMQTWETRGIDWGTDFYNVPLRLEHIYKYDTIWNPKYMNEYLGVSFRDPARFWGILNVKYLTAREPLNLSGFRFVKRFDDCTICFPSPDEHLDKGWGPYVYENTQFLPRAYMIDDAILVVGKEDAVVQMSYGLMLHPSYNPSHMTLLQGKATIGDYSMTALSKYSAIVLTEGSVDGSSQLLLEEYVRKGGVLLPDITKGEQQLSDARLIAVLDSFNTSLRMIDDDVIVMSDFDHRTVDVTGEKGFLVYSEKFSQFKGWKAEDDRGKSHDLIIANRMNTALYLDGSVESLQFSYLPRSYVVGVWITLLSIFIVLGYFGFRLWKRKN
ncbi:MAG: hypothetical protein O2779_00205 [Nanoarchaeota archaeon]|nr:hypothetical protein [Nanoarchaeota archaeon]